jgi:DNA-binding response OmpR family regulator
MAVPIVEDEPSTLFAYAKQLSRAGVEVIKAACGQQAVDLMECGVHPSVVVLDLGLPDLNGCDLVTYMHTDVALRDVPTVVVTGADPDRAHVSVDTILLSRFLRPTSSARFVDSMSVPGVRTVDRPECAPLW